MANEQLRTAIYKAGMTLDQLSERVEVDPKTIERWISKGRLPHRANRHRVALALALDEGQIWPDARTGTDRDHAETEIARVYPSRGSIAMESWVSLIEGAMERIDVLAFAGSFLHDSIPDFVTRLADKAESGVEVRLLFGDPEATAVEVRGEEEGIGDSLRERCRLTWKYLLPLADVDGVEMRRHGCTLYQSMFRFDDNLLVNLHTFGAAASQAPVLHLHHHPTNRMTTSFARAYERIWDRAPQAQLNQYL